MKLDEIIDKFRNYEIEDEIKDKIIELLEANVHKTVWNLKIGDIYYFIDLEGNVIESTWENDEIDWNRRNQGNVYLTKQEAVFEKTRREVYTQIKRFSYEFSDVEWKETDLPKYTPVYDCDDDKIINDFVYVYKCGHLYFKSEEAIKKAIEHVGEENFVKYYFKIIKNETRCAASY